MDWTAAIERNGKALRRILAMLVAMAGGSALTFPLRGFEADLPIRPVARSSAEKAGEIAEQSGSLANDAGQGETIAGGGQETAPTSVEASQTTPPDQHAGPGDPSRKAESEAEQPKPIIIWRQGRFENRPRHRHDARGRGRDNRPQAAPGEAGAGQQERGNRRPKFRQDRPQNGRPQQPRPDGPPSEGRPERPAEGGKERFERKFGKPRPNENRRDDAGRDGGRRDDRRDNRHKGGNGGERGKSWSTEKPREERAQRFDPDSPFAKLAALRDQLKK